MGTMPQLGNRIFKNCHQLQLAYQMHPLKTRINMFKTWTKRAFQSFWRWPGRAAAQDTTPLKLTLKDAVGLALKQNRR